MKHTLLFMVALGASYSAMAAKDIPIKTNRTLIETKSPIMFAYHDEDASLAELDLETMEFNQLELPKNAFGFDYGKLAGADKISAFVMNKEGIFSVDKNGAKRILATNALLSKLEFEEFEKINFISDINNDGLSDIILPDLTHSEIYLQNSDKTFTKHSFKTQPKYSGNFSSGKLRLDIDLTMVPKVFDINQDGLNDLVFHDKEKIDVLYATSSGYQNSLQTLKLPVETGKLDGVEANRRISKLLDINNDGKLDLVTRYAPIVEGMDSLDVELTFQIFYGKDNGIFATTPLTLPKASGTSRFEFENDFNGDGKNELQKFHVDFGLGTIASMALGGGSTDVDVEISFYAQKTDGSFSDEPDSEKEVEMEIGMGSGDMALTYYTGDINGDGKQDAVFKTGSKTLSVYYGHAETVLNKRRSKIKQKLPEDGNDIKLVDINNDGKHDFVLHFKDDDGKSTIKTILN
ncbi:VCBS repeat-containing protein [Pseudoalteromonas phenolica]|uniref:VCBS repeat-containing protein n=1 Tax=Pseudoalteromonas phenolica TaxID=161398 RepID=A0A5S3YUR2_9GAMM|nr:VCBS repeat-containing protein [Pseudoalteromonas phenolica]TMP80727.1 VCBS repeat-containing protein [Pseudoalteromonas phenolica]